MYHKISRLFSYLAILLILAMTLTSVGSVYAVTGNERFHVQLTQNNVEGYDWPVGATVTLTIDDPGTIPNPDVTRDQTADPDGNAIFNDVGGLDLAAGMFVTMTDGTTLKEHTVTPLAISTIDAVNDTISGTNAQGANFYVTASCGGDNALRFATADVTSGDWSVDFSVVGTQPEEQTLCDLGPGSTGEALEPDEDADHTDVDWRIPDPHLSAQPLNDVVNGWQDWELGATAILTIDDPGTGINPDHTDTTPVVVHPGDPNMTWFHFEFSGVYDLKPGDIVTVTDSTHTESVVVTPVEVTSADAASDTVSGTAEIGTYVYTEICDISDCYRRHELVDGGGNWTADFSVPGDEPGEDTTYDLQPGDSGNTIQWDDDGDETLIDWRVRNPLIGARANHDSLEGWDWPVGPTLTIEIDDPATGTNPDYSTTTTAFVPPWDPNQTYFFLDLNGVYDLKPGDDVSVTDGSTTKNHTVTELQVTSVDPGTDVVSGTAAPSTDVEVGVCDEFGCAQRFPTADTNGDWSADFSTPGGLPGEGDTWDIVPGTGGDSAQYDPDGDSTRFGWNTPSYTLHAVPSHPEVHGHDWPSGASIDMYVDDDGNYLNGGILHSDTKLATPGDCGEPCFDLLGVYDLQVGDYVTFTDGSVTKVVQVSVLHVTDIDTVNETISGIADPDSDVMVNIHSQGGNPRHVVAAGDGSWTVDYSVPGDEDFEGDTADLEPGDHGRAIQLNPDGSDDGTLEYWGIPPVPFTKSAPSNGALDQSTGLTLTWDPSSPEATYEYCYDTTDDNNCDSGWVDVGANTSVVIGGLSFNTDYYWQVRANNEAGTTEADDGTWWNFKTKPLVIITKTFKSQGKYDGWVLEKNEISGKGGSKNNAGTTLFVGDDAQDRQYRSILSFGTAAIPDNAVITSVILKVKKAGVVGTNPMNTHKGLFVDIRKGKFYTKKALQIQDFQANANKLKAGKFANKLYSGWYKSVLYAGALPYINVKGITQFRLRFLLDDNDDLSADILKLYSGNSVLANRPQLIVKYYVP